MSEENKETPVEHTNDPVKRITRIALIAIAIVFIWYVVADRLAPWTDQARVQAYVVPIVSQVAGRVTEINVGKDQEVKEGEVLLKINPADYQLAVDNAETELDLSVRISVRIRHLLRPHRAKSFRHRQMLIT